MPHKHRRKDENEAHYNLPPTAIAKALPVGKNAQTIFSSDDKKKKKTEKTVYAHDDTPKAFARLLQMQEQKKLPSGLDNGDARANKKRKRGQDEAAAGKAAKAAKAPAPVVPKSKLQPVADIPKIMPGEKLRDYNARVDQALPIAGLAVKGKNKGLGTKERQTKTEKRLHKMYADWRKEDERIKEKAEEEEELREEDEEEKKALYGEEATAIHEVGKKGKRRRMIGEQKDDKDDPWAVLKTKRDAPKGLHDVAQAPPEFTVKPKEKFKVKNNARVNVVDVPNSAGSLKRREELGAERKNIIEQYRALMSKSSS